jgi:PTS system mannose-specific IID component
MRVRPMTRLAIFARSLVIQGSWNYRTLIGGGFAFALIPLLRAIHRAEPERLREAVERHAVLFNSHPYLASIALGAVAVLEESGEDPRLIERFKAALRGSLGTLGDQLVWAGWRPVCVLLALALLLAGAPWWLGVLAFLLLYNAGHLALRVWGYRLGWREGKQVGERLRRSPLATYTRGLSAAGAFLVGLVLPLIVAGAWLEPASVDVPTSVGVDGRLGSVGPGWGIVAVLAGIAGAVRGARLRTPLVLALSSLALIGIALKGLP